MLIDIETNDDNINEDNINTEENFSNDTEDKSDSISETVDEKDNLNQINNDNNKDSNEESTIENTNEEKVKELEDKYKRLLAEFDNFRKRTEKEKKMMTDFGATLILTKILPVVDNIERALNNIPEDIKDNPFVDGIDKTYKQILKIFDELKVEPIKALNEKFDSNLHNAVMTDEESDKEVDTITEELQKGWTYKGEVIRHSMVKVKK